MNEATGQGAGSHLWYVRRGTQVMGPFPERALRSDYLLGRFEPGDLASQDRSNWAPIGSIAVFGREFMPGASTTAANPTINTDTSADWAAERRAAMLRWADERSGAERRAAEVPAGDGERRGGNERRNIPSSRRTSALGKRQERAARVVLVLLIALGIALVIGTAAWLFGPSKPIAVHLTPAKLQP